MNPFQIFISSGEAPKARRDRNLSDLLKVTEPDSEDLHLLMVLSLTKRSLRLLHTHLKLVDSRKAPHLTWDPPFGAYSP